MTRTVTPPTSRDMDQISEICMRQREWVRRHMGTSIAAQVRSNIHAHVSVARFRRDPASVY